MFLLRLYEPIWWQIDDTSHNANTVSLCCNMLRNAALINMTDNFRRNKHPVCSLVRPWYAARALILIMMMG